MLPWLLTFLALAFFMLLLRPAYRTTSPYSETVGDSIGRYNLSLQYPDDKYSPDVAYVGKFRPVQQGNVMTEGTKTVNGQELNFSWLGQDISQGNPISWSDRPNAVSPFRPTQNNLCNNIPRVSDGSSNCRAEIVIQGSSVPLAYEMYASRDEGDSIVPFGRKRASLACCPSTYTTDQGCVCGL